MDLAVAVLKAETVEDYHLASVRAFVAHRSDQAEVILKEMADYQQAHKKVRGATSTEKGHHRMPLHLVDSAEVVAASVVAALAVAVSAVAVSAVVVSAVVEVPSAGPLQIAVMAVMAVPPCHRGHQRRNRSQKRQTAAAKKIRKRQARVEEVEEVPEVL